MGVGKHPAECVADSTILFIQNLTFIFNTANIGDGEIGVNLSGGGEPSGGGGEEASNGRGEEPSVGSSGASISGGVCR